MSDIDGSEHEDWTPHLEDHLSVLADALTAAPPETRAELLRLRPLSDKKAKRERAMFMLRDLENSLAELAGKLDSNDRRFRQVRRALEEGDSELLKDLGFSDEYAWLDDCVRALIEGAPFIEVETVGPYISHHLDEDGTLSVTADGFPDDETAGLLVGRVVSSMARQAKNFRTVALLDDIATPDGSDLSKEQSDMFIVAIASVLRHFGLITSEDQAGKRYHLIRESDQIKGVDELTSRLRDCGEGMVDETSDGDVVFYPSELLIERLALDSENRKREFRRRGILLKRNGRPTCHALDAATFLAPRSSAMMHLIMLDKDFVSQQEKTYALVRALDLVTQSRYHNVFYDSEALQPHLIAYTVAELLAEELRRYIRTADRIDDWESFSPEAYVKQHYTTQIIPEDQEIIRFVVDQLVKNHVKPGSVRLAADIGSGPNFYPAMLLAPYIADDGAIDMIDYGTVHHRYVQSVVARYKDSGETGEWAKYEQFMVGVGGPMYTGAFKRVCEVGYPVQGSIFALPRNRYDVVASYFVSDSITTSRSEFWESIQTISQSVRRDGFLIFAHMIGSHEYTAGSNTHFPSVELTTSDVAEAYRDAKLDFELVEVNDKFVKTRDGYRSMAVAIARRTA
jgi:hypothetical protein